MTAGGKRWRAGVLVSAAITDALEQLHSGFESIGGQKLKRKRLKEVKKMFMVVRDKIATDVTDRNYRVVRSRPTLAGISGLFSTA